MIAHGILLLAELSRHVLHAAECTISERVAVGIFVAESNRVPPVSRSNGRKPVRPDAGVSTDDIFNQPVAVRVGGKHVVGPALDFCVVDGEPAVTVTSTHTFVRRNEQ